MSDAGLLGDIEWRDGRWFMVSDHPTAEGGVVFVRTDITEQKRVQTTLRDNEAFKSAMVNASLDPIITTYDGRRIIVPNSTLFVNPVTVNTAGERRRLEYDIKLPKGSDVAKAKHAILRGVTLG